MKHIITIITITLVSLTLSSNVYGQMKVMVNKNNTFVEFNEETDIVENPLNDGGQKGSANYYTNCLGYSSNEVDSCGDDDLTYVNIFNKEIIFYFDFGNSPAKDIKIDYYRFVSNLMSGIEEHNIRQEVVEKSLGIKAVDNIIVDESNGFIYKFNNGVLVDYKNINGLSDDANDVKNTLPKIFAKIENDAKRFYSSSISVNEYINKQCQYFSNINISYLRHASNPEIDYNYALLYAIFYTGMTLDDFNFLVPHSKLVASSGSITIMGYNNYSFIFEDNILVK
jgi:hypothetical protein